MLWSMASIPSQAFNAIKINEEVRELEIGWAWNDDSNRFPRSMKSLQPKRSISMNCIVLSPTIQRMLKYTDPPSLTLDFVEIPFR